MPRKIRSPFLVCFQFCYFLAFSSFSTGLCVRSSSVIVVSVLLPDLLACVCVYVCVGMRSYSLHTHASTHAYTFSCCWCSVSLLRTAPIAPFFRSILFCRFFVQFLVLSAVHMCCEWWFLFLFHTFSATLLLASRFPPFRFVSMLSVAVELCCVIFFVRLFLHWLFRWIVCLVENCRLTCRTCTCRIAAKYQRDQVRSARSFSSNKQARACAWVYVCVLGWIAYLFFIVYWFISFPNHVKIYFTDDDDDDDDNNIVDVRVPVRSLRCSSSSHSAIVIIVLFVNFFFSFCFVSYVCR